jgi:hypothetical protein
MLIVKARKIAPSAITGHTRELSILEFIVFSPSKRYTDYSSPP